MHKVESRVYYLPRNLFLKGNNINFNRIREAKNFNHTGKQICPILSKQYTKMAF
jgi:hypothetical protein